ncbi:hypothetical protein BGP_2113 [Beggiatoa sp. PS]|nr:hypothetical protein BGP_2113 [Beggiatoa sp. PS]
MVRQAQLFKEFAKEIGEAFSVGFVKLSLSIKISWAGPSKSSNCPELIAHTKAQIINPIRTNDIGINKNSIPFSIIKLSIPNFSSVIILSFA